MDTKRESTNDPKQNKYREYLEKLASKHRDLDFNEETAADGGNFDDAFYQGISQGEDGVYLEIKLWLKSLKTNG